MKKIIALVSVIFLVGCTHRIVLLRDRSPSLAFDDVVKDERLIRSAVDCVRQHIARYTRGEGPLILQFPGERKRRFEVVEVWDMLTRHPDAFTIQVDANEVGATLPHVLHFRLELIGLKFRVIGIEYGPQHLRQNVASPNKTNPANAINPAADLRVVQETICRRKVIR